MWREFPHKNNHEGDWFEAFPSTIEGFHLAILTNALYGLYVMSLMSRYGVRAFCWRVPPGRRLWDLNPGRFGANHSLSCPNWKPWWGPKWRVWLNLDWQTKVTDRLKPYICTSHLNPSLPFPPRSARSQVDHRLDVNERVVSLVWWQPSSNQRLSTFFCFIFVSTNHATGGGDQ